MRSRAPTPGRRLAAALSRIRSTSHLHDRGQSWHLPEAALVWQIWVQALTDVFGTPIYGLNKEDRKSAMRTAMTGMIVKPDGTSVNALELLGIDPAWAYKQVETALAFKEAA